MRIFAKKKIMSDDLYTSENNMQDKYRVVVMNDETFEEVRSFRLTRMNAYMLGSALLFVGLVLTGLLFALTPLKRLIPGYGDIDPRQVRAMNSQIDSLESQLSEQIVVFEAEKQRLSGNYQVGPGNYKEVDGQRPIDQVAPTDEELALRDKFDREAKEGERPVRAVLAVTKHNSVAQQYFTPPLKGYMTAPFQPEKSHFGLDVTAPRKTPVQSVLSGTVILSEETLDTGKVIAIQHKNNIVSFYKHNSVLLEKVGTFVQAGQAVAIIGNTGELSDGPHLHFELWYNGKPVDPADYINF